MQDNIGRHKDVTSNSEGSSRENKRRKIDKDERGKEIQNMSDIIKNIKEQIEFKQLHLRKQKSLNDFAKCDQISEEIRKLMNEKKILEKQLKHMEKKEAKSKWYYNTKGKEKSKTGKSQQKDKKKTFDFAKMWKKDNVVSASTSTSTCTSDSNESGDTLILSSDNEVTDVMPSTPTCTPYVHPGSLHEENQSPALSSQHVDEEAGNQSPTLFGQQVDEEVFKPVGEHIQLQIKEPNDDAQEQMATVDKDFL